MRRRLKLGFAIVIGTGLLLAVGCNQNKTKFPKGSVLTIKYLQEIDVYQDGVIEEIVEGFKKTYPNVEINLDIQKSSSKTISNTNQELKKGKGTDVIIGNDLPFQAYAEKGYLIDITNCVENVEKLEKKEFFRQIKNSFSVDGKIYAEPCGFKLYAVQGSSEVLELSDCYPKLVMQLSKEYLLHPESKVQVGDTDFSGALYPIMLAENWNTLYKISADKIFSDGYQVNMNELKAIFSSIKELKDNTFGKATADLQGGSGRGMSSQISDVISGYYPTALDQVAQMKDLFAMQGYKDWKQKEFALFSDENQNPYYSTCYVVGISSKNRNEELAKEFVKYMLTFQESMEYLPLARNVMADNLQMEVKMDDVKSNHSEKDTGYITTPKVKIPSKNQKELLAKMDSAVLIKNGDGGIKYIVTEYAQKYINNNIGLEEVVDKLQRAIDEYLQSNATLFS